MADTLGPLRPDEEKLYEGQPKGFPLGDYKTYLEDVMLPEGEDMGIPSDDDSIGEDEIETETGFGSVIVVDNIPKVAPEKQEKLMSVIDRIFGQIGSVKEGGVLMPKDSEGKTLGYAFIEYNTPQEAQDAQKQTNEYRLDKNHTFSVCMYDDFEKYSRVPEEYTEPEEKPYVARENLQEWCVDQRGRDQFMIRYLDDTEIFYNDAQRSLPESVYKRNCWTDMFVQWSPQGSFVATMHAQGVAIWGGVSFQRLMRLSHPKVQGIQFSPGEKFLITFSSVEPQGPRDTLQLIFNVFDVKTGKKLRNFQLTPEDVHQPVGSHPNAPIFKWAGGCDDRYFAKLGRNQISVYETPECHLLDKKSIKLEGVQDFQWSPSAPIISACQAEQSSGNLPARVVLLKIPERTELRQKNLFSVSEVAMFWHPQGDSLAVKVDRFTKTRKTTYTSFELFGVKDRDIPMEVLELSNKADKLVDFAWEPRGTRFAMLHGDGPRPSFSLYAMKDGKTTTKGVQLMGTQTGKQANQICWSPQGKYLVLAGLKGLNVNGQLEFISADDMEVLSAAEHFLATEIEWDPTGRYVATAVTAQQQMENGLNMWLFNGQLIYRLPKESFFQFLWRPRPPSKLSKAQEEDILKNLKKYSKKYDEEDAQIMNAADTEIIAERTKLMEEWKSWYQSKKQWLDWFEAGREDLLGDGAREGEYTVEEVIAEVPLGAQEEVLRN